MPRRIPEEELQNLYELITLRGDDGLYQLSQRQIESSTGMSRQYIRKKAKEFGRFFPQNGIDILGCICICKNCEVLFRKPKSRVIRAQNQFCSETCRSAYQVGPHHPSWKTGESVKSFSKWIANTSAYNEWKNKALERAGYQCEVTGRNYDLDVHHIAEKAKYHHLSLDLNNALVLNRDVHKRLHSIMAAGKDYDECIRIIKNEFGVNDER